MERTERFHKIDYLLKNHRQVSMAMLIDKLEVSESTIKRDISYMRDRLQAPILWTQEKRGYHYTDNGQFQLPGLWLNASELHALITSQQLLSQVQPGLLEPHIQPLQQRIQKLLKPHDKSWQEASKRIHILQKSSRSVEPQAFQTIAHAVLTRKQLNIHYYNRQQDQQSQRTLSPQRLIYYRDNWYLDAHCHLRKQLRSFALDSIEQCQWQEQSAVDISEEQLDQHLGSGYGIFAGEQTQAATLRFTPQRARWVSKECWHPKQHGHFDKQGYYQLEIPYSQPTELVMDILKYGADVEVLAPQTLRQAVIERVEQMKKIYEKKRSGSSGELVGGVESKT